jgi:K319-like protein
MRISLLGVVAKRLILAILILVAVGLGLPHPAWAVTVSNPFATRDNVGPNNVGSTVGDRLLVGASNILPSGPATTVTATQGTTVLALPFLPLTLFPDQFVASIAFDPALTGAWSITATRDGQSATASTSAMPNPQLIPLVQNLHVVSSGLTPLNPTLTWEMPNLSGFTVSRIRIRVIDAITHDQFFQTILPLNATTFVVPTGVLRFGGTYVFRIMIEDVSAGFVQSRSSTFSLPYIPVPAPIANAGPDQTVHEGSPVGLDGSGSGGLSLAFEWVQISGFPVILTGATTPTPRFEAPSLSDGLGNQALAFQLTVSNGAGSSSDIVNVFVTNVPDTAGQAQLIIDSSVGGLAIGGGSQQKLAQVVTPSVSGLLTAVKLPVACEPTSVLILEIQGVSGSVPNGVVLASQTIAGGTLPAFNFPTPPTFRSLVFSAPPPVTAGNRFAIVIRSNESCGIFQGPEGNPYPGGDSYFDARPNPAGWAPTGPPRFDLPFQVVLGSLPTADAGPDQSVTEGDVVRLDGAASAGPGLSFRWIQVAGPPAALADTQTPAPTFIAPLLPGGTGSQTLTFELTVSNAAGSSSDTIDVLVTNVNHAPESHAGAAQTVREGTLVVLDGRGSFDPDGDPLVFRWIQVSGIPVALVDSETVTPSFTAPSLQGGLGDPAILTFALTVTDGVAARTDEVSVTVEQLNHPPVADPGLPQTVRSGRLVGLDGTGSFDPDGDQIVYRWTQLSGVAVQLTDGSGPTPTFIAPATSGPMFLTFRLVVSDTQLDSEPAPVIVTVVNDRPLCELARAVPDLLWPANHRMVPIAITGVTDPDNDTISIQIKGVTQDEPVNGLGDGDTSPDALIGQGTVQLRAERSGSGNGRVYQIRFSAHDGRGGQCTGVAQVAVPRSAKPSEYAVDDGQRYDSTQR